MGEDTPRLRADQYDPALQEPITRRRDRARLRGIFRAVGEILLITGFCGLILYVLMGDVRLAAQAPKAWVYVALLPAVILLLWGMSRWREVSKLDEENYLVQKATPMTLDLVNLHDDIWTEGLLVSRRPLRPRAFPAVRCAWFRYRKLRRVDKDSWEVVSDYKHFTTAQLRQEDRVLDLDLHGADFQDLPTKVREDGDTRHEISWLGVNRRVSVTGVVVSDQEFQEIRTRRVEERLQLRESGLAYRTGRDDPYRVTPEQAARFERLDARRAGRVRQRGRRRVLDPSRWRRGWRARLLSPRAISGRDAERCPEEEVEEEVEDDRRFGADGVPVATRVLTAMASVPMLITPLPRNQWWDRAEADEEYARGEAVTKLWVGLSLLLLCAFVLLGWAHHVPGPLSITISGLLGAAMIAAYASVGLYNRFIAYRIRVDAAFAHIEIQLELRHELIPKLLEVTRAYSQRECALFEELAAIRTSGRNARAARTILEREARITEVADRLLGLVESHPELQAHALFGRLHRELTACEGKIAHGRSFYNEVVEEYNTLTRSFPRILVADAMGFPRLPYWQAVTARKAPPPRAIPYR